MLLGIAGAKRSGKTLLASLLAERHGLAHLSFAAPIRAFVADLLGGTLDQLELEKETPIAWLEGVTPRHMMQTLGTEWGRQMVCQQLWVRICMRKALLAGRAVISDVRFPNEAHAIHEAGGKVIRLLRWADASDSHISERPLDGSLIDYELANDSESPETLLRAVEALLPVLRPAVPRCDPGSIDAAVEALMPPGTPPNETGD